MLTSFCPQCRLILPHLWLLTCLDYFLKLSPSNLRSATLIKEAFPSTTLIWQGTIIEEALPSTTLIWQGTCRAHEAKASHHVFRQPLLITVLKPTFLNKITHITRKNQLSFPSKAGC